MRDKSGEEMGDNNGVSFKCCVSITHDDIDVRRRVLLCARRKYFNVMFLHVSLLSSLVGYINVSLCQTVVFGPLVVNVCVHACFIFLFSLLCFMHMMVGRTDG